MALHGMETITTTVSLVDMFMLFCRPRALTFPLPVTPRVAIRASLPTVIPSSPSPRGFPNTPPTRDITPMPSKTACWETPSSKTCVNSNVSIVLLRRSSAGGLILICRAADEEVGADPVDTAGSSSLSMLINRSFEFSEGRRRKNTSKRDDFDMVIVTNRPH